VTPRPRLTDAEAEELLGAYALDACEPDETLAIEAVLARRPDLAREAARLAHAAAWIGAVEALEPPVDLGMSVLAAARARRAGPVDPFVDLYLTATQRFGEAVAALPDGSHDAPTTNGLSARDLVVHMASQESLLAQNLDVATTDLTRTTDIVERTNELLSYFADHDLDEVLALWEESIDANRRWAVEHAGDTAPWRGLGLARDDVLVVRAFEAWIHGDDLRRVAGLDPAPPAALHLRIMSEFASRILPLAVEVSGRPLPDKRVRFVLTGEGGGDWIVALGNADAVGSSAAVADVTLTADVVDWCMLVGDRISPDEIRFSAEGDVALGRMLVAAAPALATL
jgi:uncharacterized protein (TIGR03083 family)